MRTYFHLTEQVSAMDQALGGAHTALLNVAKCWSCTLSALSGTKELVLADLSGLSFVRVNGAD